LIYLMCTLRYADKLDTYFAADENGTPDMYKAQGEGLTFWRTIAPLVAASAPTGAALVSELYNLATAPTSSANFCEVRAALRLALPAGITSADMGELVGTNFGRDCANYAPVNSVLDDVRVSLTVRDIKAKLTTATGVQLQTADFVAAKGAYEGSYLEALAQTSSAGSAYETTSYDSIFIECVDGTGVWAGVGAGKILAKKE
jgi:hypothetical protein